MAIRKVAAALFASVLMAGVQGAFGADEAKTVPTFHCLSVYWSPAGGAKDKKVEVKFREAGSQAWHEGLAMKYSPIEDWKHGGKAKESQGDYRGSIVNLTPGTNYEIALTLEGTDVKTTVKGATWSEKFPIASTVKVPSGSSTLNVNKSGTPDGYVLYDGTGSTIDGENKIENAIEVNASYVILRGFTLKNTTANGILLAKAHNVIIENCDISKWGSEDPKFKGTGWGIEMQSGVYSKDKELHAIVIQRCKIHDPTYGSNSWSELHNSYHPDGPQAISFWDPDGNNVIRYNEFFSGDKHYFNDVIGGAFNGSYRGFPGHDSDVYGNYNADCWDDGMEIEGGGQNVRVFNNYIEHTNMMIANAATSIGPLYIWNNVTGASYTPKGGNGGKWDMVHGNFMKMGYADSDKWMSGHMYVFNNTIYQGPENTGSDGPGGDSRIIRHCVTRNNIFQARPTDKNSISTDKRSSEDNDFDHDLISARVPANSEANGVKGVPTYVSGAGFNFETKTGNFALAPDSPGKGKGVVIPNFCEGVNGAAPDMGAQQSATPMVYGVKAEFVPAKAGK